MDQFIYGYFRMCEKADRWTPRAGPPADIKERFAGESEESTVIGEENPGKKREGVDLPVVSMS